MIYNEKYICELSGTELPNPQNFLNDERDKGAFCYEMTFLNDFANEVTFGKSLGHLEMGLVARGTNLVISESEVA